MAAGDITKRLIARIREYIGDSAREIIKSDLLITDKLSFYQDYIMTTKLVSRLKVTYPLIANQPDYEFLQNVVQHTFIWFNEDITCIPIVYLTKTTSGDDSRKFTLTASETFRTGTDFMYSEAFTRSASNEKITKTVDPIIEEIYHEMLIEYVAGFLQLPSEKRMAMTELHTKEISEGLRAVNRFQADPMFMSGRYYA